MIFGFVAALVAGTFMMYPSSTSHAQNPTPGPFDLPPELVAVNPGDTLSFELFGISERTMHGPFDSARYTFGLPAEWALKSGAELHLDLATFFGGATDPATGLSAHTFGGTLQVSFNGITVDTILLDQVGERTVKISLPPEVLAIPDAAGRHELSLLLISDETCLYDFEVSLVVRPSSRLVLPHEVVLLPLDLSKLPRPIYQLDSFARSAATIVISDNPSASELQAALIVAGTFGRTTVGNLLTSLVPFGKLSQPVLENTHLIIVGKPAGLPILSQLGDLPLAVVGDSFNPNGLNADDGILQMVASPWSPSKVALVVGGNSDLAIVKAAQALSTEIVFGSIAPNLALVAAVNPAALGFGTMMYPSSTTDRQFVELGYANDTINRIGVSRREFVFYIPPGQTISEGAYFSLIFNHSALLDYTRSGLTVNLNNQPVGSGRFSDDTAQVSELRISIPQAVVRPGFNRLALQVDLVPITRCSDFLLTDLWFSIYSNSLLHLPLIQISPNLATRVIDLANYPGFMQDSPALGGAAFVLSASDPVGWHTAAQLAYDLGNRTNWVLAELAAVYGYDIPEVIFDTRDLLVVGRPSTHPIITALGQEMPAPFPEGSDVAEEKSQHVIYRLPQGASVGYLELMLAPWNKRLAILSVLGNSDQGITWAGNALTISTLRNKLKGNLAVINGENIVSSGVQTGVAPTGPLTATAVPGGTVETIPTSYEPVTERPTWVLIVVGAVMVLMALVVFVAFVSSLRKRR